MEKLLINTPQNVNIEYRLAPVATRFISLVIDYAMLIAYAWLVYYLISKIASPAADEWLVMGIYMLLLLPVFFYHFLMETFLNGQTIGKMAMKTKVVRLDGGRASVYEYFIRWAMSTVDIWIMGGAIGLISIVLTQKSQRIGDMAANTTVISLKSRLQFQQTIYEELAAAYQPVFPEVMALSDKDINIIKQSYHAALRRGDYHIINRLTEKITEVTGARPLDMDQVKFIETVLKDHFQLHKDN